MKTSKKTLTILLMVVLTLLSCKEATQQEKQVAKIEHINNDNGLLAITEYYDRNGNKTKVISHSEEYGDSEEKFLYDNDNNLTEAKEFNSKGELVETKFYEYKTISDQEVFELTYEKRKGSEKRLIIEDKIEYNSDGNLFRKSHQTVYGNWFYNYSYDSNNRLKEETILAFEDTEKSVIAYNKQGKREIERIYRRETKDDAFELTQTNQWYYNEKGEETNIDGEIMKTNNPYTQKLSYHN